MTDNAGKRILIASLGTIGDVEPTIAVGVRLRELGFDVRLATSRDHARLVIEAGLTFCPIRPDSTVDAGFLGRACLEPAEAQSVLYRQFLLPSLPQTCDDLLPLVRDADLLIAGLHVLGAGALAELADKPWAFVAPSPLCFGMPKADDRISSLDWFPDYTVGLDALRADMAAAMANANRHMGRADDAPSRPFDMPISLFPELFIDQAPELMQGRALGLALGFPAARGPRQPMPRLDAFLDSGAPPAVLTLGSTIPLAVGSSFYETAIAGARQAGLRLVALVGREDAAALAERHDGPDVLVLEAAPHEALFPRADIIIHHGGMGTLAKALQAGKPSLVVPFAHDQPFNALFLQDKGLAQVLGLSDWRVDRLSQALRQLSRSEDIRRKCAACAAEIGNRDGARLAAMLIARMFGQLVALDRS